MITDTTFFTNEPGSTLLDRFRKTLKDVQYFDILVGYFRTSGFHQLYESFESHKKTKHLFIEKTVSEMEYSEDSFQIEIAIKKFLDFLTTDSSNKEQDVANGGNGKKL